MLTGEQYLASLRDGRATYIAGRRIDDLTEEPLTRHAAAWVARTYDRFYDGDPAALNPMIASPRDADELRARIPMMTSTDFITFTTFQSLMTLLTVVPQLSRRHPELGQRIYDYVEDAKARDIRITECITDAKGDRAAPPARQVDPDAYVRVVERRSDGVVIRGAKLHITGASLGHELFVMPTKRMKAGEEDYAIACAVPVDAPGVTTINTTYAPRHDDDRDFPFTRHEQMPDCFVIFEDVFVPHERVFLDGQVEFSALFAHSLGLWERTGGVAVMAQEADTLVGLAQLIAEANGLARIEHIREKVSELVIYATLIRAGLEAAITNAHTTADGFVFPDELYMNAAKYHGAAQYNEMVRHLHDIAGGAVVTAPAIADLEHSELGPLVTKYMTGHPDVTGEQRIRLFHAIRDLTADAYGGWHAVTNVQSGGGLYAQRIVTRKHYDMDGAKGLARRAAGLEEPVAAAGAAA